LGKARRRMTWRQILVLGLHFEEEMAEAGFRAYWSGSERVIPDKGGLRDYWMEISSDRDFLGLTPSYVYIRDPMRRLCHKMIECSISGRGQGAKKYLFRHAEGRKSGARLSRGHFIGHLTAHFSLLARLNICLRFGDTWAWVAQGPKRQQPAVAGAPGAADDALAADEGAQAVAAPMQAPQPQPHAPQYQTMSQRIKRLKEELIDASGHTYQAFDSTLVGSSRLSYQRCVRPRKDDVGTSTAPLTDD
ncbi:hypothetical protein Tco_1001756, partial [Tanacetum coccineum]